MRAKRGVVAAVVAGALLPLSGCLGIPKAQQVEVEITDDGMVLIEPRDEPIAGGETVITIFNFSESERELVLAETDAAADALPAELVDAISPRDDDRIVAITAPMDEVGGTAVLGLPQQLPTVTKIHTYLEAGSRHLLFDKLGGYRNDIWIELKPDA